jgi:serine palmitoyltransferase
MRNAASYLAALSQADADARARKTGPGIPSEPALSLRSSVGTDDGSSYVTSDDSDDAYDELDRPPHAPTSEQQPTTKHSEFGHCFNEAYRYTSGYKPDAAHTAQEDPPYYILITTYISYLLMIIYGHSRDFIGKRFFPDAYRHLIPGNVGSSLLRRMAFYVSLRVNEVADLPFTGLRRAQLGL